MEIKIPLSQTQLGIYLECERLGGGAYNWQYLYTLDESLDMERLARAVEKTIQAHPYMEVRISDSNADTPTQFIPDTKPYQQSVTKISESEWQKTLQSLIAEPLKLIGGRLFRFDLVETERAKYMLFTWHNIAFDGMSHNIIMRDIAAAYNGEELTQETYNALDIAREESQLRVSTEYQHAKEWYESHFSGLDVESLPEPDKNDSDSYDVFVHSLPLNESDIKEFCRAKNISTSALTSAAFALLMGTYTNQHEALFSTIYHGRKKDSPRIVGMFVKTLPVYGKWDGNMSVDDFLAGLSEQIQGSRDNDIFSFIDVNDICPMNGKPMFVWQDNVRNVAEICEKPAREEMFDRNFIVAPMLAELMSVPAGLSMRIEYNSGKYSREFIAQMSEAYENILRQLMAKTFLREIEPCPEGSDTLKLLDTFNENSNPYDDSQTMVSLLRKSARENSDRTAVIFKEKHYTYKQLDEISEKIAYYALSKGLGRGDVVSILIPRNEFMVIATLGALKAGCAYQPLDPTYPPERLNFMVKDSAAKLLITTEELRPLVSDYNGEVLLLNDVDSLPAPSAPLEDTTRPEDLFILLYTSGSTGTPKGVRLTHGNLVCFMAWYTRHYGITSESVAGVYASYGFDACMSDLYPALLCGGAVCIVPEDLRLDLVGMNQYFEANNVTHSFITTQVGWQFAVDIENHSLKHLTVGGEKLVSLNPPANYQFHNVYGPTECTICVTEYPVASYESNIPIGKTLDNTQIYIIDGENHRVPAGALGEILIAGPQVADGYLNRPEKTAEVFIDNPFGKGKAYKTGDIARYRQDGNIEFFGRRDMQVKIRGFRIELTEVEAVIRDFPGVKDATLAAFDTPDNTGKFIAAYVVGDKKIDISALNQFIKDRKPPYMVPAVTMQIDSIPLNQNHKVNKRALPKPEIQNDSRTDSRAAPLNILETDIKAITAEIIGTDSFGITDALGNFGLTSISSIRLATQIYKKYGVQIQVRKLVSEGSVQSIENEILRKVFAPESRGEKSESEKSHEPSKNSCGLTFEQQGVYADCMIDPSSTVYNTPFSVKIPEGVTVEQIRDAVRGVVEAHPYILCRFTANDKNEIIQEPIPNYALEIPVKEMSAQDYANYRKEGFVRPFNLSEGPLVRFEIVKSDGLYLLVDMHHLVTDGASVDIFLQQLCSKLDGHEIEKEEYSYYDYAAEETLSDGADEFFAGRMALSDEATQIIPDVYGDNLKHSEESVSVKTDIEAVKEFALKNGATPAEIYLAAGYITLSRFVCDDTVSILTISNGRSNMKINSTLGMFVNSLPLVETIDSSESVSDFIKRTAKNFNDTLLHENYPFARIASKFDFHPAISYAYQIGVLSAYDTKYGAITAEELTSDRAKIPVAVFITGTENDAEIKVSYDSALYSREIMQGLAECYENAVRGILTQGKISDISITDSRQWEILDSYNPEWDLNYDINDTPVSAFRRNAKNNPDKVAAVFMDKQYTYRELDGLTDKLAAKIYSKMCGITGKTNLAGEVVSIIIPRNENVFILPLSAVKAGCAYEPLDPSYPQERLNFMVKDSGARLLIADDSLRGLVNEYDGEVLLLSELYGMEDTNITPPTPSPEDLFIMLYTSGSTGTPKGCQIEHRNVVALSHGIELAGFYREDDRIADYASFGFDVNMADVFCTLINGGTVYIISEDIRMNLDLLAKYFDEAGITALLLTTQVGVQFMQNYPNCKTLRLLIIAGEKLPAVDPSGLSYTIANGYGPTENCYGVSLFPIHKWEQNIPIGKPFRTIHGYILDKTGHRLPAGAAGEYCVSGPQVSRGYINRPDKTAEAYEDCPFNEYRMYHTGDIVRYRQDGNVEFVGRKDGQVKIRGFRIETKEIEAVIRSFDGVKDATVQAYDYESGGKYLAAFVVGDNAIDKAKLADYIKSQKPAYMVPPVIMQIDKVPLTINQKVDRKALPKPKLQQREYVAPAGKAEEDFCAIFGEILGLERVGAEDDFFELGGSSVIAMRVVIAAGKKGYSIVYNDVFKYTTPRLLAEFVTGSDGKTEEISAKVTPSANTITEIDEDGYDYSAINSLLAKNTMEAFRSGERQELGNVLLAGATGYLGIHVLRELLTSTTAKVYCLIRPKDGGNSVQRLKNLLEYYFGNDHAEYFTSRLAVIEGDATDPDALKDFAPDSNITIINCAASVKHFAKGNEIERANVDSVKNLVAWCEANNARLVHISTGSIIGGRKDGLPPEGYRFDEHVLFAGQTVKFNQYIHSKFMAERFIYEEILTHGLSAKVFRVGDLAPRLSDGKFQVNFRTNNIMNTLRAYKTLGMASFNAFAGEMEFSPIDCLAKAVVALAGTPKECVCFMPINPHRALMQDIFAVMGGEGKEIRPAEDDEFADALNAALSDSKKNSAVSPLAAYANNSGIQELSWESLDISYTVQVLYRLGFKWPETGAEYIRQFIRKLDELSFFDE